MVSIGHSLSELEKVHRLQGALAENLESVVLTIAQYLIDFDPSVSALHRQHLTELATAIGDSPSMAELGEMRSLLREELRDYRDQGVKYLKQLRDDLSAKAASLQQLFEAMTEGDGDHEERLTATLANLRKMTLDPASGPLRPMLLSAIETISKSLEELKRQNQLSVAQFLVEIQVLHNRIESLQTAVSVDATTQLASRQQFESDLRTAVSVGAPFSLLLLRTRNTAGIHRQFGEVVLNGLLSVFAKRLRGCVRTSDPTGRWGDDRFAVLIEGSQSFARTKAKAVAEHCAGLYVCMVEGKPVRPVLQLDVGVVDYTGADSVERLIQRSEEFFRAP